MNTSTPKQSVSFRWNPALIHNLKVMAKQQNRSVSNLAETLLQQAIIMANHNDDTPNETTLQAIAEARSGKKLEPLDLEHFDEFVNKG